MTNETRERLRTLGATGPWFIVFGLLAVLAWAQHEYNVAAQNHRQQTSEYLNSIERLEGARVITDADGKIREWNDGMSEMLGWDASEVMGERVEFLLPEDLRSTHRNAMIRALDDPVYGQVQEITCPRVQTKSGTPIHATVRVRIEKRKGEPVAIATFERTDQIERLGVAWSHP